MQTVTYNAHVLGATPRTNSRRAAPWPLQPILPALILVAGPGQEIRRTILGGSVATGSPMARRHVSLASLLATAVTLTAGYAFTVVAIVAVSNNALRDLCIASAFFAAVAALPMLLLRPARPIEVPFKDVKQKRRRRWWPFWRRRKRKPVQTGPRVWKRRRGQEHHRPWGTPEGVSVFVPAQRRHRARSPE